jgi:hypothetical protein
VSARRLLAVVLAAATLLAAPSATAKDFKPGDLLVCNATRCLPIANRSALKALSVFYYGGACPPLATRDGACTEDERKPPESAAAARLGAAAFELRFTNGYVTGIVATKRLDRFLSYGVHVGWFERGRWYRVPDTAAQELRRLTTRLTPLRVTRESLSKSR